MADFTRFISYLYDYRGGERNRNQGFVKVESRQGMCRVTVVLNHGQVLERNMTLCGYIAEDGEVRLVRLGEMEQGLRERQWKLPTQDLGGLGIGLDRLAGVILLGGDRSQFMLSVWNDGIYTAEQIRQGCFLEKERPSIKAEQKVAEPVLVVAESETEEAAEMPQPVIPMEQVSPPAASEGWRALCKIFPAARPFEPSVWEVLCISLQDIGRLPPENWVWGSNHFLLHGFYQYHHLILARQRVENCIYLGVPGEFGVNEKFMAAMFGLHQFQRERQGKGEKGYWLTPIRL